MLERRCFQCADLRDHEGTIGREQFSWTGITRHTECSHGKTRILKQDCTGISLGVAGNLAQNPISTAHVGEHHRWPQLRLRQVGKGKMY
jgi:hypothetical protein